MVSSKVHVTEVKGPRNEIGHDRVIGEVRIQAGGEHGPAVCQLIDDIYSRADAMAGAVISNPEDVQRLRAFIEAMTFLGL